MTMLQDGDAHDAGPCSSIGVRLPPDLRAKIEAAAAKEALSVSSWLRRAALRELHGRPMPERIVAGMGSSRNPPRA